MGARRKAEDGHDAIVRRLLASQGRRPVEVSPARSPADLLAAARRFTADILPGLRIFSGPAIEWSVREVRQGTWDDALALASPLTRADETGPRLAALVTCDEGFLSVLMAGLFGTMSPRRPDPTASELSVFAQLAVRLRDGLDTKLDYGPPERPADCMRLFQPQGGEALVADLDVILDDAAGHLAVIMTPAVAARFLPTQGDAPRPATGMTRLPLEAEARLPGPRLRLREVADLAVGRTLAVSGEACLCVGRRTVAHGHLGREGERRTLSIERSAPKEHPNG